MRNVNVAVIGVGRMGPLHARNLAQRIPQARLFGVADIIPERAQKVAAELNVAKAVVDYHELLADEQLDAVVIATNTPTHPQIVEDAALAGKHIFCEKPITFDLVAMDRALMAVASAGVKFQVGFNRRFDRSLKHVHDLVAQGAIGAPHLLRISSRDPEPPSAEYIKGSGGIFLDMTIHDFDTARYLVGSEVEEVFALGNVLVDPEIAALGDLDTVVVNLRFANGAIGVIDNSRRSVYGYDQRVEVFGSQGMARNDNETLDRTVVHNATGAHSALNLYFFLERYAEAYVAEMQQFIQCLRDDKTPPVTAQDGRMAVVLGYAARQSYEERRPVRL